MSLHYGEPQVALGIAFAVIAFVVAVLFALVARRTRADVPLEEVQGRAYRLRKPWLAFLAALLVAAVGMSALLVPYSGGAETERTVVKVTAGQFFWQLEPSRVPAGTRARFEVGSADVNHGFGLYDPRGRLLGSVQAMPGYTNKLDVTLERPGRYRILCLEYCGLAHHLMQGTLTVEPRP